SLAGLAARPSASVIALTPAALGLTSATRRRPSARSGTGALPATYTVLWPQLAASFASAKLSSLEHVALSTTATLAASLQRSAAALIARSQPAGRPSTVAAARRCSRSSWYVNRPSSHIQ